MVSLEVIGGMWALFSLTDLKIKSSLVFNSFAKLLVLVVELVNEICGGVNAIKKRVQFRIFIIHCSQHTISNLEKKALFGRFSWKDKTSCQL